MDITMLNSMAGQDFTLSLDTQRAWGVRILDLKGDVLGKNLADLTDAEATQVKSLIDGRGMSVHCMSSVVFESDIEVGEEVYRKRYMPMLDRIIGVAGILKPAVVRLIAATSSKRAEFSDSISYIRSRHSWLIPLYQVAISAVNRAGFRATIENECHNCLLSQPDEIVGFYEALGMDNVSFTYDVQNLWQMGTFPSVDVYRKVSAIVDYVHVKGGIAGPDGRLLYASSLQDASWPVADIVRAAISDGCPVLCLNPSHGKPKEGYDYAQVTKRDLDFVRSIIPR